MFGNKKKKVLFLCLNNSVQSQMAEGTLKGLYGERFDVFSAGLDPTNVDCDAILIMRAAGFDIRRQSAKEMERVNDLRFDYLVTLCDEMGDECPVLPTHKRYLHNAFTGPEGFVATDDKEFMESFAQLRDGIMEWVKETFASEESMDAAFGERRKNPIMRNQ